MGGARSVLVLTLGAVLLAPAAASAGFALAVNPERLNGSFGFVDKKEANNLLDFEIVGETISAAGNVTGNSGSDLVSITYWTIFPDRTSANEKGAAVSQRRQVLIQLELVPGEGSSTPAYFGEAAPGRCKAQAKIRDNETNDPDDPDKSQSSLRCDLGRDFQELEPDPPAEVLTAAEAAFDARKDTRVDASKGRLQIKHAGRPAPGS